jgi:hypothetical protein
MAAFVVLPVLIASCRSSAGTWDKERVIASEAGSFALRSRAKTLKVPFTIEDEKLARKAFLAYDRANFRSANTAELERGDAIRLDQSDGRTSFYVILKIGTSQIALFALKGGSEVSEVAIDLSLLK